MAILTTLLVPPFLPAMLARAEPAKSDEELDTPTT
jgi:hypothetical protein